MKEAEVLLRDRGIWRLPFRLDVFSRYVVGWIVAHRESATLAERLIRETCARQSIAREQLTVHADRGPAMTSKPVALLLADRSLTRIRRAESRKPAITPSGAALSAAIGAHARIFTEGR